MSDKNMNDKAPELGLPLHESSTADPEEHRSRHHTLRTEIVAFLGELIGTFMFLSLAFSGTQIALNAASPQQLTTTANAVPDVSKLLYIAFAFGVSLAINVAIFAELSGGKFNPAVTAALWLTRKIHWHRAVQTIIAQLIAGIAAAGFVSGLLPGPLIIATKLDPSISIAQGLFLEAFVTTQLILTILMLDAGPSKPMYIGLSLFIAQICSVFFTGGSLNPARSFGPAVVTQFTHYHWIYWIGPLLGSGLASGIYALINWVRRGQV
ncbi:lens fiber major intrinsic protein [Cucurbitaria berberidis CBS 394.84]|uniref:Lens fiber major intrinsic protein n=1 Tax=Cucurbitaria berberidis CBS 394.84 TaxID=1168544 RepID=A0A9P4GR11_9PLEO|nr:lens fiber major intrinsic protein [Cucurbitaria berberidis CBS 394.84]KAF1849729.1 lens fiber major intrinsic protein [Cucurbitaria berberidis CBS 394.84]